MFGELLKNVLAPPVPQVLGLCAFLSTSALIFAKDIISVVAHNEVLGGVGGASRSSVVPMILDYSVIPAPRSSTSVCGLQEGTRSCGIG